MANTPYYVSPEGKRETPEGQSIPLISQNLDSVRTYQFEIHFGTDTMPIPGAYQDLVLAAKQVSQMGMSIEPIEVHRVNDKVFYPGKASPEELTVTFDNFYKGNAEVSRALWRWYQTIYNPITGMFNTDVGPTGADSNPSSHFKTMASVYNLNAQGQPISETKLIGLMPISWKTAEFNYSTNEFHTIEMGFRYDFMDNHQFTK
jgi:hypothetical protein